MQAGEGNSSSKYNIAIFTFMHPKGKLKCIADICIFAPPITALGSLQGTDSHLVSSSTDTQPIQKFCHINNVRLRSSKYSYEWLSTHGILLLHVPVDGSASWVLLPNGAVLGTNNLLVARSDPGIITVCIEVGDLLSISTHDHNANSACTEEIRNTGSTEVHPKDASIIDLLVLSSLDGDGVLLDGLDEGQRSFRTSSSCGDRTAQKFASNFDKLVYVLDRLQCLGETSGGDDGLDFANADKHQADIGKEVNDSPIGVWGGDNEDVLAAGVGHVNAFVGTHGCDYRRSAQGQLYMKIVQLTEFCKLERFVEIELLRSIPNSVWLSNGVTIVPYFIPIPRDLQWNRCHEYMIIREVSRNSQRPAVARFSDPNELEQKYIEWYFLNRFGSLSRFYFHLMRMEGKRSQPMFFDGYKHTYDLGFPRKRSWPLCMQIQTRRFPAICKQKAVLVENMYKLLNAALKHILVGSTPQTRKNTPYVPFLYNSMGQSDISCTLS